MKTKKEIEKELEELKSYLQIMKSSDIIRSVILGQITTLEWVLGIKDEL